MARLSLVIDACIGGPLEPARAGACGRFRAEVLQARDRAVMDRQLFDEWRRHQTRAASGWIRSMFARKLIERLGDVRDATLREAAARCPLSAKQKTAVQKDLHLIETAHHADRIVVSVDSTARDLMAVVARTVAAVREVHWYDPVETPLKEIHRYAGNP